MGNSECSPSPSLKERSHLAERTESMNSTNLRASVTSTPFIDRFNLPLASNEYATSVFIPGDGFGLWTMSASVGSGKEGNISRSTFTCSFDGILTPDSHLEIKELSLNESLLASSNCDIRAASRNFFSSCPNITHLPADALKRLASLGNPWNGRPPTANQRT